MDMPMILPQGIVINTGEVYAEVASYPVVPLEKIYEFWHVYTTTQRRLTDPTAYRLENFWWHVWGSNRRKLSGEALARLYENISTGPTFVPLRGPPNRFEVPPIPRFSQHESDRPHPAQRPRPDLVQDGRPLDEGSGSMRGQTPSSSRPPPPHPILKKARGPSTSGPRPTARFVSPAGSEDDEDKTGEDLSSGSTAATGLEIRSTASSISPAKTDSRKSTPTKKFVASTASKRRPVLPRRPSSQSSGGSEAGSREASSAGSRYLGSQRSISSIAEQSSRGSAATSQESLVSSAQSAQHLTPSAKALGKRPAVIKTEDKRPTDRSTNQPRSPRPDRQIVVHPPAPTQTGPRNQSADETRRTTQPYEINRPRNEPSPAQLTAQGSGTNLHQTENTAPSMARSMSHSEVQHSRETHFGRLPPHGLISSSVAATSNIAARATFDFENPDPSMLPTPGQSMIPNEPGLPGLVSRMSTSSLLDSRFTPTQPSPTPAVPLGRSKSQLTLLLEREKARIGDMTPKSSPSRGKKKDKRTDEEERK